MKEVKKVGNYVNIGPHYRDRLWKLMASDKELEFHFIFGHPSRKGIKEIDFSTNDWQGRIERIHIVRNIRIRGLLIMQIGVVRELFRRKLDSVIILGDYHILTNWIVAIIARFAGKPVFFWGHGIKGNENKIKLFIRKTFLSIGNKHFTYSHSAKRLMVDAGFDGNKIAVIYNSLDYDLHLKLREQVLNDDYYISKNLFSNPFLPILVFIGRLTQRKKLDLLIQAVIRMNFENDRVNLVIIGDGPVRAKLKALVIDYQKTINIYGPCYDEEEIGLLISNASICVSPGSVGLTAIHSLAFGTPVITHNNFCIQGPEFEAIEPGKSGDYFEENSLESLIETISDWVDKTSLNREQIRMDCYQRIDKFYNPYNQLEIFKRNII